MTRGVNAAEIGPLKMYRQGADLDIAINGMDLGDSILQPWGRSQDRGGLRSLHVVVR